MDENNRNFILAIVLSMVVLFAWQFFFVPTPPPEAEKTAQSQKAAEHGAPTPSTTTEAPRPGGGAAPQPEGAPTGLTREEALAVSPRIAIDTPALRGSIARRHNKI